MEIFNVTEDHNMPKVLDNGIITCNDNTKQNLTESRKYKKELQLKYCFDIDNSKTVEDLNLLLTLSALQTKTYTFANSVDPDETAHKELSHLGLHCLPFCFWFYY